MADPAASVKSIASGKINLYDGFDDISSEDRAFYQGQVSDANSLGSFRDVLHPTNSPSPSGLEKRTNDFRPVDLSPGTVDDTELGESASQFGSDSEGLSRLIGGGSPEKPRFEKSGLLAQISPSESLERGVSSSPATVGLFGAPGGNSSGYGQFYRNPNLHPLQNATNLKQPIPHRGPGIDFTPPPELEPASRPWSRNSTTSCLSTTATKDGVEGKMLHRLGPTLYSNTIIANMLHHQQESSSSIHTTGAEVDGDSGVLHERRESDFQHTFSTNDPPEMTLKEKVGLIGDGGGRR